MKLKHFFLCLIPFLTSCVGEDIITDESLLVPNLSINRPLRSIAVDEKIQVDLRLTIGNEAIDLNTTDQFTVDFSTDTPEVIDIDDKGEVTPKPSSVDKLARIIVSIKENVEENPRTAEVVDEVVVGAVTISENEAAAIPPADLEKIISQGYDPKITIMNLIETIAIDNTEGLQLSAVFQNRKNEIEEVDFMWESSDVDILTVSEEGLVLPVIKGDAIAIVTTTFEGEEISAENNITVGDEDKLVVVEGNGGSTTSLGSGSLISNSSYTINGSFEIVEEGGQNILRLGGDFDARSTPMIPDLVIYLSNSTTSNAGAPALAEVTDLELSIPQFNINGAQDIVISDDVDPADFQNVLLYCRDFGVKVGFGIINR